MIESPHGWTSVIYHSGNKKYLDKILLIGLIAGGIGRKGGQECYLSAAYPQKSMAVRDHKSWKPQSVPYVHHKWHTDTVYEIDLVKAPEMYLKVYHAFNDAVFILETFQQNQLQESVGYDQTVLCKRFSGVAPHAPAIQEHVRASGDRLLLTQTKK